MRHQTLCRRCGKPTWVSCGRHVERALADVRPEKRCARPRSKSLLAWLLRRSFPRRPSRSLG